MAKNASPQTAETKSPDVKTNPSVPKAKADDPPPQTSITPPKKEVDVSRGAVPKVRRTEPKPEPAYHPLMNAMPKAIVVDAKNIDFQHRGSMPKRKRLEAARKLEKLRVKDFDTKAWHAPQPLVPFCGPSTITDPYVTSNACLRGEKAKLTLTAEPVSWPFRQRTIWLRPNIECQVGRQLSKNRPNVSNAIFDSKVLSRHHAVLWFSDDGRFWIKDTKSSNGTFVNDIQLTDGAAEMFTGDVLRFGCNIVENMYNELHSCITARVQLYLPDGSESLRKRAKLLPATPAAVVPTYADLQHLNEYIEEAAQSEDTLNVKISHMKTVLDSTRVNSSKCWQAMLTEDQLLQRIRSLEKMLEVMQQDVTEDELKVQMAKMVEDKELYEQTAKQVLRKVHQERMEAQQMLSKVQASQQSTEHECQTLREQVKASQQSLQQMSDRLLAMEAEYQEYKKNANEKLRETATEPSYERLGQCVQTPLPMLDYGEYKTTAARDEQRETAKSSGGRDRETEQALATLDSVFEEAHTDPGAKAVSFNDKKSAIVSWLESSELSQSEGTAETTYDLFGGAFGGNFSDPLAGDEQQGAWMNEAEPDPQMFDYKLANVQQNLQQLELNMARAQQAVKLDGGVGAEDAEFLAAKNVVLLKESVATFHEVYDDFCAKMKLKSLEKKHTDGGDKNQDELDDANDTDSVITIIDAACKNTAAEEAGSEVDGGETIRELSQKLAAALKEVDEMNDIMQVEQEVYEQTVGEMEKTMAALREENQHLEHMLSVKASELEEQRTKAAVAATAAAAQPEEISCGVQTSTDVELEIDEAATEEAQRDDDLTLYREMLVQTEQDNVQLRQLITELQNQPEISIYRTCLLYVLLPTLTAFVAVIAYFMINYN